MLSPVARQTAWKGTLPQTEDYVVSLYGGPEVQPYTLTVELVSRIKFPPGAEAAKIAGSTAGDDRVAYALFALKDRKVEVTLYGVGTKGALTVWGYADGKVLLSTEAGRTSFSFKSALTQDYIFEIVPKAGQTLDFVIYTKVQ